MKRWADIKNVGKSPERIAKVERDIAADLIEMQLAELREQVGMTQAEVAAAAGMGQGELSRFEGRDDHRLSNLRRYVQALGGSLEVVAVLGDRRVTLRGV